LISGECAHFAFLAVRSGYYGMYARFFFFLRSFICEAEGTQAGGAAGRVEEKQASRPAGSLMWGSIPGPWDHDLS